MNVAALRKPEIGVDQGEGRPIDLVHLARQTLGDRALEVELLQLFDKQAAQIITRLAGDTGNPERRWRQDLAHTLKGSARAIGGGQGANAAQHYENVLASTRDEAEITTAREALVTAVDLARQAIRRLLAD